MIQYPHIDVVEDGPVHTEDDTVLIEDDSIFTYWGCRRWSSILILRLMMKMHDVVPKLPMRYRDSPISCTIVMMVVVDVEYLPS